MPSFTFRNYDVQNSVVIPDPAADGSPSGSGGFQISTERSRFDAPKLTTVSTYAAAAQPGDGEKEDTKKEIEPSVVARIDWKAQTFEVKGVSKPFAKVKHNSGGGMIPSVPVTDLPTQSYLQIQVGPMAMGRKSQEV